MVDLRNEQVRNKLAAVGITSYLPLANFNRGNGGIYGLPIVTIPTNGALGVNEALFSLAALGADAMMALGAVKPVPRRPPPAAMMQQQQQQQPARPMMTMAGPGGVKAMRPPQVVVGRPAGTGHAMAAGVPGGTVIVRRRLLKPGGEMNMVMLPNGPRQQPSSAGSSVSGP